MSKPAIVPETTTSGIAVDPRTLERVIPESRRPDGSVRKQIKIRPGFTPQEDVRRFRGTRQAQMDATSLPKGHIIGWAPPSASTVTVPAPKANLSKAAKKNEKRKEKRKEKKEADNVKDNWEDDDDDEENGKSDKVEEGEKGEHTSAKPNRAAASDPKKPPSSTGTGVQSQTDGLADQLEKLEVR